MDLIFKDVKNFDTPSVFLGFEGRVLSCTTQNP
jgi:hypothetical protein